MNRGVFIRVFSVIIIIFISLSLMYSQKVDIDGNINEKFEYSEIVNITTDCGEELLFIIHEDAENVQLNREYNDTGVYNISGCLGKLDANYSLDALKNEGGKYRLERRFKEFDKANITYSIKLPFNFKIDKNQTFPENYTIDFSENGNFKILKFGQNSDIYIVYFEELILEENENLMYGWNVFLIALTFFILGFITAYILFKFKKKVISDIPPFILLQEEREILEVIKNNPGINQKQIGRKLNLSKAKVSYIINDLEQKKLINREKFGRSFKVYINKNMN